MACSHLVKISFSTQHACEFFDRTTMVNEKLALCEVGEGCHPACLYSYASNDVVLCPECKGDPDVGDVLGSCETCASEGSVPHGCPTCDVFGVIRIPKESVIQ